MSNPTTLVEQFAGDAGAFAVTGPERYDIGLWLEEGTTNELANSSFESNATGWNANNTGNAISRVTTRASDGTASLRIVGDGSVSQQGASNSGSSPSAASGEKWALSADIYAVGGETVRFVASERNSGGGQVLDTQGPTLTLAAGWHRRNFGATLAGGGTVAQVRFKLFTPTAQVIDLNLDACQLEKKPYPTSYTAGTRAASSASVATANHLLPGSGSLAFRFRRLIDTGGVETLLECGTDGDDWMKIYIDASDKLNLWWSSGGALPTYVTSVESIAVDTEYFVYAEWDDNTQALSINNGAKVVGTRDTVVGDWGAGPLTLKAE